MLSEFVTHSSIQSALPLLIDTALKGAILVIIAACAAYLLRKRSAASRHAVWTAAVIGHLAIPAFILILPAWRVPVLPAAPWMRREPGASVALTSVNNQKPPVGTPNLAAPSTGAQSTPTAPGKEAASGQVSNRSASIPSTSSKAPIGAGIIPFLATIWFAGAMIVLLRLAIGTWKVGQLARGGARVEDGVWLSLAQRLANRLGVMRPLILLRGERLAVPVTWGIVYPAVLLPQDSDSWTEERRRFVLVHEMAHVKRFDALTQLIAQIAVAVFWFDPLVWFAAHQMRVEREHACDDYVLRDGTAPSLYAGELLEMVRSIGTPSHDRAAPAFAALAMARRSEFEGRMLSILDPRLDRKTLNRRGTLMTAVIVALLTLPLAALRPYQQPAAHADEFPASFKVSISEPPGTAVPASPVPLPASPATVSNGAASTQLPASGSATAVKSKVASPTTWSCDNYRASQHGTSTHINSSDNGASQILQYLVTTADHCAEATVVGPAKFSADETRIAQLAPGGFARFRERTSTFDRAVSVTPVGDGSLSYAAMTDGRSVPFDAAMQGWLSQLLPEVLREAAINVPERVARLRAQGGVPAVLQEIGRMHSSSAKRAHYEELIKHGPTLSAGDAERIAQQVGTDLTSSGDLSSVLQMLPRSAVQSPGARRAIADALSKISSSGDKANTLQVLAPNADPDLLILLANAAADLPSSGDKANFLIATAAEYLTPSNEPLRDAYFRTVKTVQSSGDMANVLISAIPYGHANSDVAFHVIDASKGIVSSGDAANVLISLSSQRVLQSGTPRATLAAIERTLTMASSGDRANVLMSFASNNLLSTPEVRDAFTKAALALPSEGDRANVLASAVRRQ
ncbi:MAG TPA: M56 family metallopeptidase [Gemmatimonadaceae bacterium]|nr:M56 family metallopeptidase [Gemmatimonadaceae bacterium]